MKNARVTCAFTGADIMYVAVLASLGFTHTAWWFLSIPLLISAWFGHFRWTRNEGWKWIAREASR